MQQPSKQQLEAMMHGEGPALVVAGPGSGKTFTIIQRICYLIKQKSVPPDQILTITFTKAAAIEMQTRFQKSGQAGNPHFGTFHSICYHILNDFQGIQNASLISEQNKIKYMEVLLKNHGLKELCNFDILVLLTSEISRRKNGMHGNDAMLAVPELTEELFLVLYSEYEDYLAQQKLIDFDDMILHCNRLFVRNETILKKWQNRFHYLQIDEFQDINPMQYQFVQLLTEKHHNLFAVGDDDQSIYGFRGSSPAIMQDFKTDYPNGKQIFLSDNYRSCEKIVCLSGKVIERNECRIRKTIVPHRPKGHVSCHFLETRMEEEKQLVEDLKDVLSSDGGTCAVILRTNREAELYAALLKEHGILVNCPAAKKKNTEDLWLLKDICAFLSFIYDGFHRCDFLKFMNKPSRFISRHALTSEIVREQDVLSYYAKNESMRESIHHLLQGCLFAKSLSPWQAVRYFVRQLSYGQYLEEEHPGDLKKCMEQIEEMQRLLKEKKPAESAAGYLKQAYFTSIQDNHQNQGNHHQKGVAVITMHASKGLEFENVFLPDCNEGVIPGKRVTEQSSIEEERRLLYVAMTRAKNRLYIYYTAERGRKLSRFLDGLLTADESLKRG